MTERVRPPPRSSLQRLRPLEPRQPYPTASDYQDTETEPVEEPFELSGDDVPTLAGISEQIGALASHVQVLHEEAALARAAAESAAESSALARQEIALVRKLVIGDHAPRITAAEHKLKVPDGVKTVGKYAAVGTLVTLVQQLWPVVADLLAKP